MQGGYGLPVLFQGILDSVWKILFSGGILYLCIRLSCISGMFKSICLVFSLYNFMNLKGFL